VFHQLGMNSDYLARQEENFCRTHFRRGRAYGSKYGNCQSIWIHKLLRVLFDQELEPTVIYCDNHSSIKLLENVVFHDSSKNIEIKYHFISDRIQKGVVKLQSISIDEKVKDILTKHLEKRKFVFFSDRLEVVQNTFLTKREC